ncbi:CPBP family intramembrane metalloprotease [Paenibacillus sp. alder61]|uniref:CPBP family intramembrane glutamic endopeptidase n=1 Tax=Paenibacillus sp. alder61 TaxID=2862948 RepID=UPI001CD7FDB8|nr:type II CAAX endopeptidase family protein [Paenibacillus sp. alder61]MCA1294900.1 CPBP family intramembrane metalloprotease [Paenibacillus sp. alder61]
MYSDPKPQRRMKTGTLWGLAALGLVLFVLLQILPSTASETLQLEQSAQVLTKEQAKAAAFKFAEDELGLSPGPDAVVTYQTQSDVYGYLAKEKLTDDYLQKYEKQFPYDVFRVYFSLSEEGWDGVTIDVHMTTGKAVGFKKIPATDLLVPPDELLSSQGLALNLDEKIKLAEPYLKALGYGEQGSPAVKETASGLRLTFQEYNIGDAGARLDIRYKDGQVAEIVGSFEVPQSYTDYVKRQKTIANWLTYAGYALFTFVLGILAIVYSALTRAFTSFKRGIALAAVYFLISMGSALNMLPYLESEGVNGTLLMFGFVVQGLVTLILASSIYFSLVGGDGLWRKQGINLWARAKERGYGRHVLSSMADGYAWALILLGVQSVIFFILERTIHTWSTTDATQSPYNMLYPALLPLLAWVAGIGEEAVYRLFGIPMLKKMFRSTLAASIITTLIWAFGHTLYPIYPVISRPIELLFIGLLFSYIFLRYGFIAVMFAHVVFDSILMSLSVMFMGGTLNMVSGLFFIVLPALVAYVVYLFNPPGKERPSAPATIKEEPL